MFIHSYYYEVTHYYEIIKYVIKFKFQFNFCKYLEEEVPLD
jgi:hypothetical protein